LEGCSGSPILTCPEIHTSQLTNSSQKEDHPLKTINDMTLDEYGSVIIGEDNIVRSYAGVWNCVHHVIAPLTYASKPMEPSSIPLSSETQLEKLYDDLQEEIDADKKHFDEHITSLSFKNSDQVLDPPVQHRPAVDSAQDHSCGDFNTDPSRQGHTSTQDRYVHCPHKLHRTELLCSDSGYRICIIKDRMSDHFCYSWPQFTNWKV
jgi:hypothetical protein